MSKIPKDMRIILARQIRDFEWDLNELLRLLKDEVRNRGRCEGIKVIGRAENSEKNKNSRPRKDSSALSALLTE